MDLSKFAGKTIAIMVSNGFEEIGFIAIQRAMMNAGAKLKVVSRETGLTNAWSGNGWGMSYPADSTLSTALAIDYSALIVPAGPRHVEGLKSEAHAKRVLRAFLREDMPVLLQGEAVEMIELIEEASSRTWATSGKATRRSRRPREDAKGSSGTSTEEAPATTRRGAITSTRTRSGTEPSRAAAAWRTARGRRPRCHPRRRTGARRSARAEASRWRAGATTTPTGRA